MIKMLVDKYRKYLYQRSRLNTSRRYLEVFMREAASSLPAKAMVLDAGAGISPYKSLFAHTKYESADFCQVDKPYASTTYVCDLTSIPVEDDKYDRVICTQVLEHVSEPKAVLQELYRLLKPNAELWLSAPLFYHEHETPYDYYRYTQFGFKYLLESVGFTLKKIEWLEGYYGTLSYQLRTASIDLPLNSKDYGGGVLGFFAVALVFFLKKIFALTSVVFAALDLRYKNVATGYCKNYAIVAIKTQLNSEHSKGTSNVIGLT